MKHDSSRGDQVVFCARQHPQRTAAWFDLLEIARKKAQRAGLPVDFVLGNAQELPFPTASFELVTCSLALEFVSDPAAALKEIYRVLKPGACFLWAFLNRYSSWSLYRRVKGLFKPSVYNEARFFSRRQAEDLLHWAGFQNLLWCGAVYFPPFLGPRLENFYKVLERVGPRVFPNMAAVLTVRGRKE